jgi:hypothetical protein
VMGDCLTDSRAAWLAFRLFWCTDQEHDLGYGVCDSSLAGSDQDRSVVSIKESQ